LAFFRFLTPASGWFFRNIFLRFYGTYLSFKSKLIKVAPQKKDRFLVVFTNRYLVHLLVLLIGIGVSFSNLMAYESKDDYGQKALVFKLAGMTVEDLILDTGTSVADNKVYNYQDQGMFIQGNSLIAETMISEKDLFSEDQLTSFSDLAIIKPDIIGGEIIKSGVGRIYEYIVQEGDTISKIAAKFEVSVETILWANNLSFTSYVRPEQKLLVPSMSGVIHKVARGDTISGVASRYRVDVTKIREANDLFDDNLIIGNNLLIPGGRIIETAKPRTITTPTRTASQTSASNVQVQGTGKMSWPSSCQRISQYYKSWIHTGLDIACPWGTPIRAAEAGKVISVQYGRTGYGYHVIIDHGGGVQTLYAHLSSIDVVVGQNIKKGQAIGAEGSTGRSTGPHLHFEVRINGVRVNPLNYIR
jgi:LysM repeat protein